ncbi:MAG: beta-ketoacyl synthase chain length factor [Pseudoalteromonas sp.]|uniref:beta-ketoacyl synthase chain length factor n=1 Tax=Pseudoalteromonas TaxID=53246 RepID=UPI0006E53A65|nr:MULTISPECIES: beta-ketoacyl synthase chain length factor [unclassified Pseudoalteromonas]KPZ73731.1 hypothetical protein AN394_01413 [Pseudoalteromonas sp. P1-26]MCG9734587.1 beta-ketoacyl synthase chain length factor [Pseudoalteromonas shioyasakiensis]NRA79179.1 beta-ketoacyl synthase chain length factor [Pseudoalteromonas sp.]
MKFVVENLSLWVAPEQQIAELSHLNLADLDLSWVAPMQRRRLSPFMKMALHTMHQAQGEYQQLAVNFSSRHGDLPKTSQLLHSLVEQEPLSPTAFGLSVHNAATGLFSIIAKNKAPMNAIAGDQDSIISAMIDGFARVHSGIEQQILIAHAESVLPDEYLPFSDEQQIAHSVSFVLSTAQTGKPYFELTKLPESEHTQSDSCLPLSLQLAAALTSKGSQSLLSHQQSAWMLQYHGD